MKSRVESSKMCAEVRVCSDPVTCNKASKVDDCVQSSLGLSARAPQQHKYQLPHGAHHCTLHTEQMQPTSPKSFTNTSQLLFDHWHLVKQSSHLTQDDGNWQKNGLCQIHKWLAECKEKATCVWKLYAAAGNPPFTCSIALFVPVFSHCCTAAVVEKQPVAAAMPSQPTTTVLRRVDVWLCD